MDVYINNDQNIVDISGLDDLVQKVLETGMKVCGINDKSEVSVTYVDNKVIQQLNSEYRQLDTATDVLSFPQEEGFEFQIFPGMPRVLGDIVISLEKAFEQSKDYNHSFQREVGFLIAHGLLHLLGYDHETEQEASEMRQIEEKIMTELNLLR